MERWMSLTVFALVAGTCLVAADYGTPSTPGDWICLTTEGGFNKTGGSVNFKTCGGVCSGTQSKVWIGYLGAVVAILLFGSNYVPVKKYDTGDGIFFQWILCIGIWLVGLVVNLLLYQPPFFMPSVLGGALWTTGQLMVVPIVKLIGLTMGLTVWGVSNMLSGWFSGVVLLRQRGNCQGLNYGGVGMVVIAVIILAFVKSEGKAHVKKKSELRLNGGREDEKTALLGERTDSEQSLEGSTKEKIVQREKESSITKSSEESRGTGSSLSQSDTTSEEVNDTDYSWVDNIGKWKRRALGFSLALFSGLFYGFQFLPVQYMKLCDDHAHSCNDLDYFFGQMCGILFASTFYMMVYSVLKRNKPVIYPRVIAPGLISGIMWGIAMSGWFVANQHLSLGVSFPIICAGPGFVSSAWGIVVFREIKGWKNISLYFIAFSISVGGLVLVGLSKCRVTC